MCWLSWAHLRRSLREPGVPGRRLNRHHLAGSWTLPMLSGPLHSWASMNRVLRRSRRACRRSSRGRARPSRASRRPRHADAAPVRDVGVPDRALGIEADPVRDPLAEIAPRPGGSRACRRRRCRSRQLLAVGVGDDQGRAVGGDRHAVREGRPRRPARPTRPADHGDDSRLRLAPPIRSKPMPLT